MNIYIVGTPRSGTTLLQQELLKSTDSVSTYETHFYTRLFCVNPLRRDFWWKPGILEGVVEKIELEYVFGSLFSKASVALEFTKVLERFRTEWGVDYFIEKTPKHLHYVDFIEEYDSSAVFIHIVRGKYENVRSLYNANNKNPEHWNGKISLDDAVARWSNDFDLHKRYINNDRHYFVSYEDLVSDRDEVISQLCLILELNSRKSPVPTNNIIDGFERWKSNNLKEIGAVSSYPEFLTKQEFYQHYPSETFSVVKGCLNA